MRLRGYIGFILLGAICITIGIAAKVWAHYTSAQYLQNAFYEEFKKNFKGNLRVDEISVDPKMKVSLRGLKAFPPPNKEEAIFRCEKAEVRFDRMRTFQGQIAPRCVILVKPELSLQQDDRGWNFVAMLRPSAPDTWLRPRFCLRDGIKAENASVAIRSPWLFGDSQLRQIRGISLAIRRLSVSTDLWESKGRINRAPLRGMHFQAWARENSLWLETKCTDLQTTKEVLNLLPVGGILEDSLQPRGRLSLELTAHFQKDRSSAQFTGRLDLRDMNSVLKYYPVPVSGVTGVIRIAGTRVSCTDLYGTINPQDIGDESGGTKLIPVKVNGFYNHPSEHVSVEVQSRGMPLTEKSVSLIPSAGPEVWRRLHPTGKVDFQLMLEDHKDGKTRFSARVQLDDVSLEGESLPFPIEELTGVAVVEQKGIRLERVKGIVPQQRGNARVELNGKFDSKGRPVKLKVAVQNFRPSSEHMAWILGESTEFWEILNPDCAVDAEFLLDPDESGTGLQPTGSVKIHNATATPDFLPFPVEDLAGTLHIDGGKVQIVSLAGKVESTGIGTSPAAKKGYFSLKGSFDVSRETGAFEVSVANVALSQELVESVPELGKRLWKTLRPKGVVGVTGNINYDGNRENKISYFMDVQVKDASARWVHMPLQLASINGRVVLTEQLVMIPFITGVIGEGRFDASGRARAVDESGAIKYKGAGEFRRVDMKVLADRFSDEEYDIAGRLSGLVEMKGQTGEESYLKGHGSVELSEGRIWTGPIFGGLVDILHLSKPGSWGRFLLF
ncbi:MAG: hypothetical protein KGZ25_12970, partial [Planctomycetes bacterium]|nr:hypothetical protein [Planctomycetota bacterium]